MAPDASRPRLGGSWGPWIGGFVLLHFAAVCAIKLQQGIGEDVCWLSHVSLALTGAGLLVGSNPMVSAALMAVLIPHSFWLFDCLTWLAVGSFPLGITGYLDGADPSTWIATAHHFYLIPLLSAVVIRSRGFVSGAFPWVALLFLLLSLASRFMLPEGRNVNAVFAVVPAVDVALVRWVNGLPTLHFLVFLNFWMSLVMMGPAVLLFRRWERSASPS